MANRLIVLYEDNHVLAVDKPAGLATQGAEAGQPSVVSLARDYLKLKYAKPGNVYIGVVSRLDSHVTGAVVLARTSKAAARLTKQFADRSVEKTYWAIVEGTVQPASGVCEHWLSKDEASQRMRVAEKSVAGAQLARLSYRLLKTLPSGDSLLEIQLETGRKHQIRVQMAACGHPILGDRKYGSRRRFSAGIALHARRVVVLHPTRGDSLDIVAPVPKTWRELGVSS